MTGDTVVVPSPREYVQAFREIDITPLQVEMLRIHFEALERIITATAMSRAFGHNYRFANLHYGRLGRLVGEKLGFDPDTVYLGSLVQFDKRNKEWHWIMREEVAQALEMLGWVDGVSIDG